MSELLSERPTIELMPELPIIEIMPEFMPEFMPEIEFEQPIGEVPEIDLSKYEIIPPPGHYEIPQNEINPSELMREEANRRIMMQRPKHVPMPGFNETFPFKLFPHTEATA